MQMVILYFITKCFSGIFFTGLTMEIVHEYYNIRRSLLRYLGVFLISSSAISYIVELLWGYYISGQPADSFIWKASYSSQIIIFSEMLAFIPAIFLFQKLIRIPLICAAVLYLQYLCIERLTSILAIDVSSYLLIYSIIFFLVNLERKRDMAYLVRKDNSIKWGTIAMYLLALEFVLDEYYYAVALFKDLKIHTFGIHSFWLDLVAVLTTLFFWGFYKMSIIIAQETDEKVDYMHKFQSAQEKIIQTFAEIMEAKSGETGKHVKRVAEYSRVLATKINPDFEFIDYLRVASMMHDVGKLMIPIEILEKPGKLNEQEFKIMQTHTEYGNSLLSHSDGEIMEIARAVAYEHHEQWDGSGYPRGLRGDEISIYAQIVSVADVYDALTSDRAYKKAWPAAKAKIEILKQSGTQFSPRVVDAFAKCFDEIEHIRMLYHD